MDGLAHDEAALHNTNPVAKLNAETMLNVLRTHPLVVMGESLTVNPFFVPPDETLRTVRKP